MEQVTVDCRSGNATPQPLSASEQQRLEADRVAWKEERANRDAARQARAEAIARLKASSNAEIAELTKLLFP